jgi:aspartate/methionine/tyrosine aminotransferase
MTGWRLGYLASSPERIAAELLEKAKIAVVPRGDEHIRISYANSFQNLSKAMDALEQVLSEWCGQTCFFDSFPMIGLRPARNLQNAALF